MKRYLADLHLHTVLSPCADYRMVPELILDRAAQIGLGILGVTDHNSGENAASVMAAAVGRDLAVLPGMEVETREGVHLLTLFDGLDALSRWQDAVYAGLPRRENVAKLFGAQLVVDAAGQLIRVNNRLLIAAIDLSLEDAVAAVLGLGGISIPAHVDRPANGLLGVLGFVPPGIDCPALEVSPRLALREVRELFPGLAGESLIQSSDAHCLDDMGGATTAFLLAAPSVAEIALACRGQQGRRIL